ncbi:pyruvate kinase [Halieaceae bacterium IMCC14734]|uniref:Pyruvate kinase n=1 Tax=Candidatus Litorirhabdus singularis TaxID=2518993 RepID=A0ABT3TJD5_9GAMM|nr:pyruvate kinase [Candidatus Litorirhabdus singularis]MCX2981905.1 pyruvate kinase [Candidatus Litorirhabdus singularis]
MTSRRKVKIVATVGPASDEAKVLQQLVNAGVNVFRMNFSHGTHAEHLRRYELIRNVEEQSGRPLGVLVDLQGPKLRLGELATGKLAIAPGDVLRLGLPEPDSSSDLIPLPHPEILEVLTAGSTLLIDDGRVRLRVISGDGKSITAEVVAGQELSSRKGINVPDVELPIPSMTEKDRADLAFVMEHIEADWVALSFVQRPQDVIELRELLGDKMAIMAKIEKPSALTHIDAILELVDGIMVARGDLGVELPPEQVPGVQKRLVQRCRECGIPVVVATHMMDSMVAAPVPTRAEASDVANAVYEGADAVMLSAETAAGNYPVAAVAMMSRIISEVEKDPHYLTLLESAAPQHEATTADAICAALREVSRVIGSSVTVTYTSSGFTSLRAARERPHSVLLSLTAAPAIARRLSIVWGTNCVLVDSYNEDTAFNHLVVQAREISVELGLASPGDFLTVSAGLPLGSPGRTNVLRIVEVR